MVSGPSTVWEGHIECANFCQCLAATFNKANNGRNCYGDQKLHGLIDITISTVWGRRDKASFQLQRVRPMQESNSILKYILVCGLEFYIQSIIDWLHKNICLKKFMAKQNLTCPKLNCLEFNFPNLTCTHLTCPDLTGSISNPHNQSCPELY